MKQLHSVLPVEPAELRFLRTKFHSYTWSMTDTGYLYTNPSWGDQVMTFERFNRDYRSEFNRRRP